jgi:hypothetical protein
MYFPILFSLFLTLLFQGTNFFEKRLWRSWPEADIWSNCMNSITKHHNFLPFASHKTVSLLHTTYCWLCYTSRAFMSKTFRLSSGLVSQRKTVFLKSCLHVVIVKEWILVYFANFEFHWRFLNSVLKRVWQKSKAMHSNIQSNAQ